MFSFKDMEWSVRSFFRLITERTKLEGSSRSVLEVVAGEVPLG